MIATSTGRICGQHDVPHLVPEAGAVDARGLVELLAASICRPASTMIATKGKSFQTLMAIMRRHHGVAVGQPADRRVDHVRRRSACN